MVVNALPLLYTPYCKKKHPLGFDIIFVIVYCACNKQFMRPNFHQCPLKDACKKLHKHELMLLLSLNVFVSFEEILFNWSHIVWQNCWQSAFNDANSTIRATKIVSSTCNISDTAAMNWTEFYSTHKFWPNHIFCWVFFLSLANVVVIIFI